MPRLHIIRGLPGSGKSTLAKTMQKWKWNQSLVDATKFEKIDYVHFEADQFFMRRGDENLYEFDIKFLENAHSWCFSNTVKSLLDGYDVIVSNTFTMLWEMENYITLAKQIPDVTVSIIEMNTMYGSIHGIPEDIFNKMRYRWQEVPESWNIPVESFDSWW